MTYWVDISKNFFYTAWSMAIETNRNGRGVEVALAETIPLFPFPIVTAAEEATIVKARDRLIPGRHWASFANDTRFMSLAGVDLGDMALSVSAIVKEAEKLGPATKADLRFARIALPLTTGEKEALISRMDQDRGPNELFEAASRVAAIGANPKKYLTPKDFYSAYRHLQRTSDSYEFALLAANMKIAGYEPQISEGDWQRMQRERHRLSVRGQSFGLIRMLGSMYTLASEKVVKTRDGVYLRMPSLPFTD